MRNIPLTISAPPPLFWPKKFLCQMEQKPVSDSVIEYKKRQKAVIKMRGFPPFSLKNAPFTR